MVGRLSNIQLRRTRDAQDEFRVHLNSLQDPMQKSLAFATDVYRALSNMRWKRIGSSHEIFACSWRYAGGIVAETRDKGETYMDFYCSGGEGTVSEHINKMFNEWGWEQYPYPDDVGV